VPDQSELTQRVIANLKARGPAGEVMPLDLDAFSDLAAKRGLDVFEASVLIAENRVLRATVAMHEDCILAGAKLLFHDEDWGPVPEGPIVPYLNYLSEGYYETATEIRVRAVRRG
jgi:hypothetical protein